MLEKQFPIIALWVHPRSMSTAIERIMRERNDLQCMHEPFMYYYYVGLGKKDLPHSELDIGNLIRFNEIIEDMQKRARARPVFFKDMSYYVIPEIFQHPQLANRMQHLILIRDPRKSILSYYKLDPTLTLDEAGVEAQWTLYQWLSEHAKKPPLIIQAESVQADPVSQISQAWQYLGLSHKPDAFHWDQNNIPEDWKSVTDWHQNVIASTGIRKPSAESEQQINQRFEQAAQQAPRLRELLDHHLPYYEKLKAATHNCA